ncbi:MAG: FG-GAP-like repeat-containing protein [Pyrinomonadaceae bacterium]
MQTRSFRPFGLGLSLFGLLAICLLAAWLRSAPAQAKTTEQELQPELVVFSENFDGVTAPALPAGWTTSFSGAITPFTTVAQFPDSPPNSVFTVDPNTQGTSELVTPAIALPNLPHKLIFRHFYQTDYEFDGCVLEMSINGGAFSDIVTAGGVFNSGGYDTPLVSGTLSGRRAWTGQQSGYITTEVALPAGTNGQSVRFKWRLGTDTMEAGTGWWIDNVQVTNAITGTNAAAITIPAVGQASSYPSTINVTNQDGLVTDVQVSLTNFSHAVPDDVDLMLVAPNGNKVILMSDVGGSNAATNLNLVFADGAASSLPDSGALSSGTFKPTNFEAGDAFPAPAPVGNPTGNRLSALNGSVANGNWQLYLVDDTGANAGSISGGWSLFLQSSVDAIGIPDVGVAQPYSSDRRISSLAGTVTKATVTLTNFSHISPDDVDIMLVAPNGRRITLMSDVGGTTEVGALSLTFDDTAPTGLPDSGALASGTFKPTDFEPGDAFPAPAPQGALTGTTLDAFYGSAPNGLWKLYVVDDTGGNPGSIAGSWSLNLTTSTTACAFTIAPLAQNFPITGGSGEFAINMPAACSWSATTNSGFVSINSNVSGNGNGSIIFTAAANFGGARSGAIDVSNGVTTRTFQVQQPSGCPFGVAQSAVNLAASGGPGSVGVTAGAICGWQGSSGAPWLQITSSPQSGDGQVAFTAQPNASASARSTTVTVGARSFQVNQAGSAGRKFDFDGDGKSDVSVFRPSSGAWYILPSSAPTSSISAQFGIATDLIAPADYDGDRKTDIAVFRNGVWYVIQSATNTLLYENWGTTGDTPVPADYDGDGKADFAVYRPSDGNWHVHRSSDNALQTTTFGITGDRPLPGDFDGDGRADIAVRRPSPSAWYILPSSNGPLITQLFGQTNDIPVVADFDGDGRDNIAVFRPGNGTWYTSLDAGTNYGARQWGLAGDVPAAADYDGDGRADYAVFRSGAWYILHSGPGTIRSEAWGTNGDLPLPGI